MRAAYELIDFSLSFVPHLDSGERTAVALCAPVALAGCLPRLKCGYGYPSGRRSWVLPIGQITRGMLSLQQWDSVSPGMVPLRWDRQRRLTRKARFARGWPVWSALPSASVPNKGTIDQPPRSRVRCGGRLTIGFSLWLSEGLRIWAQQQNQLPIGCALSTARSRTVRTICVMNHVKLNDTVLATGKALF